MNEFKVRAYKGPEAKNHIDSIADLRIRLFRDFPYLYDGNMEYEKDYLERYFQSNNAKVFLLFYKKNIIGATTCLPLNEEAEMIRKPFEDAGLMVEEYFYFGESIIERIYRGKGLGKLFFKYREQEALSHNNIKYSCFCSIKRENGHPKTPGSYRPLDGFWASMEYKYQPNLYTTMYWKETETSKEVPHRMEFWIKQLR